MNKPKYSVIIPTHERCETLKFSIKTVLDQTYNDYELVIMDNASQDETKTIVDHFNDKRIKYYRSPKYLSMMDNWELALSKAKGQYVMFIGDDDGLLPQCLQTTEGILNHMPDIKAIKWKDGINYWWPDVIVTTQQNMLFINFGQNYSVLESKKVLKHFYETCSDYDILPSLYHGIVKKDFIWHIRDKFGAYFIDPCPDVYSGIVNSYFSNFYMWSNASLSIKGISSKSTGLAAYFRGDKGRDIRLNYRKESSPVDKKFPRFFHELDSIECNNIQLGIADTMLFAKKKIFPNDEMFTIDRSKIIKSMCHTIKMDYDGYEEAIHEIMEVANIWKVNKAELTFPKKNQPVRPIGPKFNKDGLCTGLSIDGDIIGISNIYEASLILKSMTSNLVSINKN